MFLMAGRVRAATALCLGIMLVLVSGCAVRRDADELSRRRVSGSRVDPSVGEYSLLGFHRDHSPDPDRARRAENLAGDPTLVPSARDRRLARAVALEEARMVMEGGLVMHRWDGSASNPAKVEYVATPGALTVSFRAAESLNRSENEAHAVQLVVYHLSDRAALDQLASHEDGMRKLLEGERFDDSVKRVRTFQVQPGGEGRLLFDRPDGGRFVAVVAGYGRPDAETSLYVTEYGIGHYEQDGDFAILNGVLRTARNMYMPLPLEIEVCLGETEMAARNSGKWLGKMTRAEELSKEQMFRYAHLQ